MLSPSLLALGLLLGAPDKTALDAAELAHAEGLLAEIDGDEMRAHALLTRASELAPQSVDFAYDLARFASAHGSPSVAGDIVRFMALQPRTASQRVLRSYLLARDRRFSEASENADLAATADPQNGEATGLRQVYDDMAVARGLQRSWGFLASVRPEIDSNVTLIPDALPFGQGGARMGLLASGWFTPRFAQTKLAFQLDVSGGIHMSNRAVLAPFDVFSVRPAASLEQSFGDNAVSATLSMNQVLLGGFTTHFLQDFGLLLQYRRKLPASLWLAALADIGYRDFVSGPFNHESTSSDRDGTRGLFGASLTWSPRNFALSVRAAFQGENADGLGQRELGPDLAFSLRYNIWRFVLSGAFAYQGRFYPLSSPYYGLNAPRADQRLMPSVTAALALSSWLDLELGYLFIRNLSNVAGGYDYARHIGQLAIRGHY